MSASGTSWRSSAKKVAIGDPSAAALASHPVPPTAGSAAAANSPPASAHEPTSRTTRPVISPTTKVRLPERSGWVGETGVAGPEVALEDLAGRVPRQGVGDLDVLGHLEAGQVLPT